MWSKTVTDSLYKHTSLGEWRPRGGDTLFTKLNSNVFSQDMYWLWLRSLSYWRTFSYLMILVTADNEGEWCWCCTTGPEQLLSSGWHSSASTLKPLNIVMVSWLYQLGQYFYFSHCFKWSEWFHGIVYFKIPITVNFNPHFSKAVWLNSVVHPNSITNKNNRIIIKKDKHLKFDLGWMWTIYTECVSLLLLFESWDEERKD